MTDLTRLVSQSSLKQLADASGDSDSDGTSYNSMGSLFKTRTTAIPHTTPRTAAFKVIGKLDEIVDTSSFDTLLTEGDDDEYSDEKTESYDSSGSDSDSWTTKSKGSKSYAYELSQQVSRINSLHDLKIIIHHTT